MSHLGLGNVSPGRACGAQVLWVTGRLVWLTCRARQGPGVYSDVQSPQGPGVYSNVDKKALSTWEQSLTNGVELSFSNADLGLRKLRSLSQKMKEAGMFTL